MTVTMEVDDVGSKKMWTKPVHLTPKDLSFKFPVVPATTTTEAVLDELGHGDCRSLGALNIKAVASGPTSWNFSPRASLKEALKESLQHWSRKMNRKGLEDKKSKQEPVVPIGRRAVLEKDVVQLQSQLHDEKTLRMGLEQALGEASDPCTTHNISADLAPQAQQLITEIVSLQKEVSHLEQHVLSLYRKVLNQRLFTQQYGNSDPSSSSSSEAQEPAGIAIPHSGIAIPQSGIAIPQSSPPSLYHGSSFRAEKEGQKTELPPPSPPQCRHRGPNFRAEKGHIGIPPPSPPQHRHQGLSFRAEKRSLLNGSFDCIDEEPKLQTLDSSPVLKVRIPKPLGSSMPDTKPTPKKNEDEVREPKSSRTPDRLAEELVRCMAAIYCKLANPPLPNFSLLSPSSSSSSTTTMTTMTTTTCESFSHESSNLNENWSPGSRRTDHGSCEMDQCAIPDPYSVKDAGGGADVGPYSSMVEVPWICVDKDRLTYAAQALHNFRLMVEQLEKVDPRRMTQEQKLAFWINIYNALMMHAYLAYGIPRTQLKRLNLLQKAAYKVGSYCINAQTIEHSILGCPSNRPTQWLQAFLNPGTTFKVGDERQAYALQTPEPAVCFALCCGGRSDPAVRVYTAKNVRFELEVAKREFLQASVRIRGGTKVLLPKVLEWYSRELVMNSPTSLLEWVCENVPGKLEAQIQQCLKKLNPAHKIPAHCLQWLPYSFGFRYIFAHDLAHRNPVLINDSVS